MTHVMMRSKHTKPSQMQRLAELWHDSLTKGPKKFASATLQTLVKEGPNEE